MCGSHVSQYSTSNNFNHNDVCACVLYQSIFKYIRIFKNISLLDGLLEGHVICLCLQVKKQDLHNSISSLIASGSTCLTAAIETATDMFTSVVEEKDVTNRVIFLTDLCSTVDSVNDEKKLLATIKANAGRGIFASVVGVGMVCQQCNVF